MLEMITRLRIVSVPLVSLLSTAGSQGQLFQAPTLSYVFTCCRLRRDPVVVKSKQQTKNSCFAARVSSSSGPGLCSGGRRSRAGTGLLLWDLGGEIRLIWEFPQLLLCFWLAGPRASAHTE